MKKLLGENKVNEEENNTNKINNNGKYQFETENKKEIW